MPSLLSRLHYHDQDVPYTDQTGMLDDYHSMHGGRCVGPSLQATGPCPCKSEVTEPGAFPSGAKWAGLCTCLGVDQGRDAKHCSPPMKQCLHLEHMLSSSKD